MGSTAASGFSRSRYRFGQFELDRDARELLKEGRKIPLQQQPFQILELLVLRAGEVVTREEIRQAVWPDDTHGQFDAGVGNAIRKIRVALNEDADNARFLETLPRQGFRFIAPVSLVMPQSAGEKAGLEAVASPVVARRGYWLAALAVLAVAIGVSVWFLSRPKAPTLAGTRPLVALGGRPTHPALSPNGEMLAFEWEGPEDDATAIYLQRLEDSSPVRLTSGKQADFWPVWSPDGKQIAYLRETSATRAQVQVKPVVGVGERVLFEISKGVGERPRLNWSPDGKWLVTAERKDMVEGKRQASYILVYSIEGGLRQPLTRPEVDWRGDSEAVFSPDSQRIAFRRTRPESGNEDLYHVGLDGGEPVAYTSDRVAVAALEYTADGGLLFSSRRGGWLRNLWWIAPGGGNPQLVSDPAFDLGSPTVSRDGKHLAYVKVQYDINLWRVGKEGGQPMAISPSEFVESNPTFSSDGQKIAFISGRTGKMEIWTAGLNGAGAVQLTAGGGSLVGVPQWSPDGKQVAFDWRVKGREGIYVISNAGGTARPLAIGSAGESIPRWSRDGRFVYFNSNRSGKQEVWKVGAGGGEVVQVTRGGGCAGTESPDGRALYFAKPGVKGIWSAALVNGLLAGAEKLVVAELIPEDCGNWALGPNDIFYIQRSAEARNRGTIYSHPLAGGADVAVHAMRAPPLWNGSGLAVSPDGKSILFAEVDRDGTSIYGR
jgi:Tol biopolymer transport system component/DNA-binding winged helix-turn-helix (wHTH) protein